MAQVQLPSSSSITQPPTTPPKRAFPNVPRLSPSRIPDQLVTSAFKNGHLNLDTFSPVNQNGSFEFDRVLKSGSVQRRVKKKGAWKASWKPAYLVLRPNLLSVYKNADETELRASITLSDVTAVARVRKSKTDNVFGVFTSAKNFHFSGVNDRDTSDWVTSLRFESRLGDADDVDLPPPGLGQRVNNLGSDTTDLSADDEPDAPGSPDGPGAAWAIRGSKSRHGSTSQRKPSGLREYSGNEAFTTSQSDLSDAVVHPTNYTNNATPVPKSKLLFPVLDGPLSPSRPSFQRSTSQLSVLQNQAQTPTQQAPPQQDPNRVIRQSYLRLLKPVPGTLIHNWKSVWVVLRPTSLSIYKSSSEYEPLRIFSASDLIDAAEIDPPKKNSRGKGEFCFQVIGLEKTMKFSAESEHELEGWIGCLKSVLAKRNRPRGQSANAIITTMNEDPMVTTSFGGPVTGLMPAHQPLPITPTTTNVIHPQIGSHYSQGPHGGQARLSQQHLQRPESALGGIAEGLEETTINNVK